MTVIIGALIEAWDELRIHKLRVLLSLVGVAVAVAAMTGVMAIGQMFAQANAEMMERWNGREVTLTISADSPTPEKQLETIAAMSEFATTFQVAHHTRTSSTWGNIQTDAGEIGTQIDLVDPGYAVVKNREVLTGSWFGKGDAQRLAPAVLVNEAFLNATQTPKDLSTQPNPEFLDTTGSHPLVIIGTMPTEWEGEDPRMWMLMDSYLAMVSEQTLQEQGLWAQLELWLGPDQIEPAQQAAESFFRPYVDPTYGGLNMWDNSNYGMEQETFSQSFQLIVLGVGTVILGIGALSLINISLVTVQQRIREIGIRRAFGATTGRVFFSIMMESVLATFIAGFVGVALAVFLVGQFPVVEMMLGNEIMNPPGFPMSAAVIGLLVATFIGALSGLIPGIVATKIKPIEAMRAAA